MRNKLKKIIKPKHTRPILEPAAPLISGYKKKKFIQVKHTSVSPITYYPDAKKRS